MKNIPSMNEPEALRAAYKAAYGDTSDDYINDRLDWLELCLLNDEYKKTFGDCVGTMCFCGPISELNRKIRKSLETGTPYEPNIPKGAII